MPRKNPEARAQYNHDRCIRTYARLAPIRARKSSVTV